MPLRRRLARWLDSPVMLERELMTLMWAGSRGYRMEPKFPAILTDDELRAIDVPVLLITGARSALLTPKEARAREATCRTRRSPSCPAATAASTGSTS